MDPNQNPLQPNTIVPTENTGAQTITPTIGLPPQPTDSIPPSPQMPQQPIPPMPGPQVQPQPMYGQMPTTPQVNPYSNLPQNTTPSSGKKKFIILGAVVVLVLVAATVFLVFGKKSTTKSSTKTNASVTPTTPVAADTEKPATPAQKTETALSKSITVTELGYSVQLLKLVRNVPNAQNKDTSEETIFIQIKGSNDTGKFYGGPSWTDFKLIADGGSEISPEATYNTKQLATANSETPYDGSNIKKGQPATGILAFVVPAKTKNFTLRYKLAATKVIGGSGGTIPAKDYDVAL
jgi:hypothetical protein